MGDEGISLAELQKVLDISMEETKKSLIELQKDYENVDRGIRISFLGNKFKLTTKIEHKEYYEKLVMESKNYVLSNAALETLAIVAYNEPITRMEIDDIRGVNSGQILRKLVARGFVKEAGRKDVIGKPILYKITNEFLDYFGLATKEDLPKLPVKDKPVTEEVDLYTSTYKENDEM